MKKIIISSIILITLISAISNCFAFEIGTKDLISLGDCEVYLTYNGVEKHTAYVVYQKDGKYYPAYCINPELNGIGTSGVGNYSVNVENKLEDVKIWRAITNGYPYKTLSELGVNSEHEAYTATKWAVYTIMYNRDLNDYAPVNTEAGRRTYQALVNIVNNARISNETPNNNQISISSDNETWNIESNEYVSKIYNLNSKVSEGEYLINIDGDLPTGFKLTDLDNNEKNNFKIGEKFKVTIPIKELAENGNFILNAEATIKTKPVLYGKTSIPGTQNYALTGYMYEDEKCSFTENYLKNLTNLTIVKKEYGTNNRLENVKFNLLDENKNVVKENLVTNENGEITLENMLPGKYYISEIETLEGYNLYTDLIEVDLDFNEEFTIVVNNSKTETTRVDKLTENTEVTSQYTETVYNVENNTTVKNETNLKKLPVTGF